MKKASFSALGEKTSALPLESGRMGGDFFELSLRRTEKTLRSLVVMAPD